VAIAGDIIGAVYEVSLVKKNGFDLILAEEYVTNDRVLTVAAA
jgi:hypothetical protein